MKTTKLPAALAALLIPSLLFADTVEVTFDAALTNETGWVYSDKILSSNEGGEHHYFKSIDSYIKSQQFGFSVTSVTIRLSCSNTNATRHLLIGPTSDIGQQTANVAEKDKQESQTFVFDAASKMRSFHISLKGSSNTGNWHVYSATISGVPIVDAPTLLRASDVRCNRFTLSWENPENAVSNRIDVMKVVESGNSGFDLEYDFSEFSNAKSNSVDITNLFTNSIPAFAGSSEIRLQANTSGIIQISKDNARGNLVQSGFADYSNMSLVISLRIPSTEHGKTFGVSYLSADGSTNQFCQMAMSTEFKTNTVSLAAVPPNAPIVFNTDGSGSNKRVVYVDCMAFVGATATSMVTNLVKTAFVTGSTTYSVRGLSPLTEYVAKITAFDADGNESRPSDPLRVETSDEGVPLSVRIR